MNQETIAALPATLFVNAKTIEALNKMCNPLASIITPETARMFTRLADIIPPEIAAALSAKTEQYTKVAAAIEQHAKIEKLMDSILPLPSRR
jgi:hypothetical protein